MASAPQAQLPLFYNDLMPLNKRDHAQWKARTLESANFLKNQHAVPLTVDEFAECQRDYPIVFSSGDNPLPLALMGLNEGANVFVDENGKVTEQVYLPAYVRRYPYMLAKLNENSEELSLCFDPSSGVLGQFDQGEAVFTEAGEPTEHTQAVLKFCERFEEAGMRTRNFMNELKDAGLLMDGEIAITQNDNPEKPFVYRGFQMVDENKLRELPEAKIVEYHKNGMLAMIHAHLFSLALMRLIFGKQMQQGKVPQPQAATEAIN